MWVDDTMLLGDQGHYTILLGNQGHLLHRVVYVHFSKLHFWQLTDWIKALVATVLCMCIWLILSPMKQMVNNAAWNEGKVKCVSRVCRLQMTTLAILTHSNHRYTPRTRQCGYTNQRSENKSESNSVQTGKKPQKHNNLYTNMSECISKDHRLYNTDVGECDWEITEAEAMHKDTWHYQSSGPVLPSSSS